MIIRLLGYASDSSLWVVYLGSCNEVGWVAMGADWHRCSIGTSEPVSARTNAVALGGLQVEYQ